MEATDERQLLAIMFTDIVGYTALTERDEAAAVRVRDEHRERIGTLVAQFSGEVVDATGDESLSVFPSALRAVDCALALQEALRDHSDLRVRIGIHLGDVLRRGSEVVGEGVNVAARVRPLAEPGGIVISEPVYQMVRTRPHLTARALGSQRFKNVAEPLDVYALVGADSATASARPSGRRLRLLVTGVAVAAIAGIAFVNRAPLLAWAAVNAPRLFATPVEQEIGFAQTTDGVRIAYATSGEGMALVMVVGWLTHLTEGLGSPLYDRAGLIGTMSGRYRFVRYDGRGFGLSDRDVTNFSLDARVRDLEAVVDALGLKRFALLGASSGGPTAIAYASRHPERVERLVLSATFAGAGGADSSLPPGREAEFRSAMELWRTSWERPMARATMVEFLSPEADAVTRQVLMHFLQVAGDGHAIAGFLEANLVTDASDEARTVRAPTLVIAGSKDTTVPLEASRRLASLIPGARLEIMDGANHVEASGQDRRLQRMVMDFLKPESSD